MSPIVGLTSQPQIPVLSIVYADKSLILQNMLANGAVTLVTRSVMADQIPIDAGAPERRLDSSPSSQPAIVPAPARSGQLLGVVSRPVGYRMIDSLEIENFRGFEKLRLKNFKRINILVGDNGSGKTSFLEAVFLGAGRGPQQGYQFRPLRGLEMTLGAAHTELYRALWEDMFYRYDHDRQIKINLRGSDGDSRSLTLYYNREQQITLPLTPKEPGATGASGAPSSAEYVPVTFHWRAPGRPDVIITPISTPAGIQMPPAPLSNINVVYVTTHAQTSAKQLADFYSVLSKQNKEAEFVSALKEQFPQITSVSIETDAGTNTLFVSLPWLDRKVPMALVSHGANAITSLLLSIAQTPKGIACVDEIESGLYHARLHKMWEQVATFAEKYETQIFASTHSQECLQAAADALDPDKFTLIQTSRANGMLKAILVDGADVTTGIKHGLEVRGLH